MFLTSRSWLAGAMLICAAQSVLAQTPSRLSLGYAVDTTAVPAAWWGVDPARAALPAVVRTWRDYLQVRKDPERRIAFWSSADRQRSPDPDLPLVSEGYFLDANAILVEALPIVAGDSSRWLLRTAYVGGGNPARPGILAMERIHVVKEGGRWVLEHAGVAETTTWQHARVGPIEYVVHPSLHFDSTRAATTAQWVEQTARRFGVTDVAPITYFQVPDLQAAFRVMGLDLALSADRVGGRANPISRVVFAADPRFGEAYRHEIAHVLLQRIAGGRSAFVGEGIAYWLGGARGRSFQAMVHDLGRFLSNHPTLDLRTIIESRSGGTAASARLPAAAVVFEVAFRSGGDAGVRHLIESLGTQEPSLDAISRALGVSAAELETLWRSIIRAT